MEQVPLLATKLYIPPVRPELVSRPRLIERLNAGLPTRDAFSRARDAFPRALTLVSAPAGFGKTTLVSEWVHTVGTHAVGMHGYAPQVAWLSLDEGDNDPARFLAYLIAALRTLALSQVEGLDPGKAERIEPQHEHAAQQAPVGNRQAPVGLIGKGMLSALQSPQPPPVEAILISLINEIATIHSRIILVLDDYHLIEAQPIHDALTFLLERLPPRMHLVIASREDPPLPLARLRARGQLTELRATDLRFTASEAAEFLNQAMGLDLSTEDIAALETRTEGWIAGLQLAALSMKGHHDATSLIRAFTGSHRYVLDYLIEEVLEQQSQDVQTFLQQTSVLERLTGSLCDAVTGQDNGQATLEMLERANLFIVPLDEDRRWYRYHHLFADLLRQRLRQTHLDRIPRLHIRASEWNEQNGFADRAIEHALRAEDFERAACLIEEQVDALWHRGELTKMRRWLERLPVELVLSKPQLCIFRAYYLLVSGQQDAGEQLLQDAEKMLESSSERATQSPPFERNQLSGSKRIKLRGRIAAIRALISAQRGDVPGIIHHAGKALEYLPEQDLTWRSIAAITLSDAYTYRGDMTASYQTRFEALKACKAAGDVYFVIVANMKLASTLRAQGRLQRTLEVCRQQMQPANEFGLSQTHVVGCVLAMWGEVLAELDDLDGAIHQAEKGAELAERGANLGTLGHSYLCLMRVLFSRGDLAGAEEIIQKTENLARESDLPPWLTNQMATWQTRLWLAQDELQAASQWARERGLNTDGESIPLHELDYYLLFEYIVLARVLLAQSRLDQAGGLLQRLLEAAEAGGRKTRLIEILILQALTSQAGGDTGQAVAALERALTVAEPEGFIRIFVDEGPPMAPLLYEAATRGVAPRYARRLLAAFPSAEPEQAERARAQAPKSELVEPLSERELEVLELLTEGLTNPEIAARLFLALNTVKAHTRNIYGKLGVHNRTQAVTKARALGILPPI